MYPLSSKRNAPTKPANSQTVRAEGLIAKIRKFCKVLALPICFLMGSTTYAHATTLLDFDFSFVDTRNGRGLVTGVIRGLENNAVGAASSVEILSAEFGTSGIGEFLGSAPQFVSANSFDVRNGEIVVGRFLMFGNNNALPFVTDSALTIFIDLINRTFNGAGLSRNNGGGTGPTETPVSTTLRTSPVPIPATFLLTIAAIGVLGFAAQVGERNRSA